MHRFLSKSSIAILLFMVRCLHSKLHMNYFQKIVKRCLHKEEIWLM